MANESREDFKHIQNRRYLIETTDEDSGRVYYTKRIGTLGAAVNQAAGYNSMAGMTAVILDTKEGDFL